MEKTISQEERIRRAEEIYQRRKNTNNSGIRVYANSVNSNGKTRLSLFKKMALQLAICAVIYIIFYLIKNTNYFFSDDIIQKTKEFLSHDINFGNAYAQISSFIENNKDKLNLIGIQTNEVEENDSQDSNHVEENEEEKNKTTNETTNQVEGIGGADTNEVVTASAGDNNKKTQMEIDAEYIKKNYNFKLPLKGTVTSRYGSREATEIISANHQGIDIGANKGTAIYAAMEGKVSLVSSEGDYRKTC